MGFTHLKDGIMDELIDEGFDPLDLETYMSLITLSFYFANVSKNYGHLVSNPEDGIKTLRENSKKQIDVDDTLARKVLWAFRETYTYGFFRSKGRYPNLMMSRDINPVLKRCIDEARLKTTEEEARNIRFEHWDSVSLLKNHDLSVDLDERELLKYTACSPVREEWFLSYDQCAFKILYNQKKPRGSGEYEPRVLSRYLKGDEGELMRKIQDQESLYYNHFRDDIHSSIMQKT